MAEPLNVFSCPLEIRYSDTDQMGVVHNAVYAVYCEKGRTELCASFGMPYHKMEEEGLFMMVAEMNGRFRSAIRYGDEIAIKTKISRLKKRLIAFEYEIYQIKTGEVCYTGNTTHLFSTDRKKTCVLPDKFLNLFQEVLSKTGHQ